MAWLDTNDHQKGEGGPGSLIEPGTYPFQLVDFEYLTTRNKNGKRIKAVFECVQAEHAGQKIFHNFNVINDSEKAVQISKDQIFDIANAVGAELVIEDARDVAVELNKVMDKDIACTIDIEKGKGTFTGQDGVERERRDQNRIVSFGKYDPDASAAAEQPRGKLARHRFPLPEKPLGR